ncbi:hypothetical protein AB5J52_49760 (plasmid) [Streptomyces sp. R39]|uniref:Uncharacterized protein n=1 Tax=Streptomyces sp. R39 TaxID=3238631 RepID=A0AB39R6L0_9ACTN
MRSVIMAILLSWAFFLIAFCAYFCLVYAATTRRGRATEASRPPARPRAMLVPPQRGTSRSKT